MSRFNTTTMLSKLDRIEKNIRNLKGAHSLGSTKIYGEMEDLLDIDDFKDPDLKRELIRQRANDLNTIYKEPGYYLRNNAMDSEMNVAKEANSLVDEYDEKCVNYVAAILDPEFNYNTGVMVKQPSLLNPPSVSIPIKTLSTIHTDGATSLCISWNPCFFCTVSDLERIKIGNNGSDVRANRIFSVIYSTGSFKDEQQTVPPSSWGAPICGIPENLPDVGVAKARLVSAKIKISFRGPILQQGGTIMAAATFQGAPGLIAKTNDDNVIYRNQSEKQATWGDIFAVSMGSQYDPNKLSPFDEKVISNGIWAKNVNITQDANGITAIFVPTDPMDEIFYKPGTFYGEAVDKDTPIVGDYGTTCLTSDKGAKLSYVFNIQGLHIQNTNPITVETYTTWEVLPTSQSASTLRNNANIISDVMAYQKVKNILNNYFQESTGIHTVTGNNLSGLISKIRRLNNNSWRKKF